MMMFDRELPLPLDVWVGEVVKHLDSPKDHIRFRATCKSWNLNLSKIMNQTAPRLMLPSQSENHMVKQDYFFHSILSEDIPPNMLFRGSGFGWLIGVGIDGWIRMLNPNTKAHFDLPPMSTVPNVIAYDPNAEDEEYTIKTFVPPQFPDTPPIYTASKHRIQHMNIQKVIISCAPHPDDDNKQKQQGEFMAIAIYGGQTELAFCKFGDNKWTKFSAPGRRLLGSLDDAIFYEGKIYGVTGSALLVEYDVETSTCRLLDKPCPPTDDRLVQFSGVNNKFLVRSVEGNLLMVVRYWTYTERGGGGGGDGGDIGGDVDGGGDADGGDDDDGFSDDDDVSDDDDPDEFYKTSRFNLYKLDKGEKRWRRIFSLGDSVLMVGLNSSVCMLPFIDGNGKWVRNCIYFCDNNFVYQDEITGGHDVGVFNLEDETVEEIFPNIEFIFPPPVWLFSQNVISY